MGNVKNRVAVLSLLSLTLGPLVPEKAQAAFFQTPVCSIIKISPPAPELYKDLVCTTQDKAIIEEIVNLLFQNTKWDLLWTENYMNELGAKITHVHPLKFLSTILLNPVLKMHLIVIFEDYFKRNGFLGNRLGRTADGLGSSLNREADKNKLEQYLADFAKEINVPVDNFRPFFQTRDWENLVRYLIQQ
jgi:hypothetical protein